ncbi:YceI family protein [Corynebacterium lizhenjunii]|uniref:YceI family protein n=1 Tax=Corynebacterium lizhenjunii TaxID=2709394 RepID=A0A7T0PC56_9CORY|nr:YceI family protein [Corynebacterium lizhenjunii]QPK80175.1 YceI family protein [Corynebacterium lizhenjunii]
MQKLLDNRKLVVTVLVVGIILATAMALGPLIYSLMVGGGVKTEGVDASRTKAASVELDGQWKVIQGSAQNYSSVGFTFDEVLPGERTTTSGSTTNVTGQATIAGEVLEQASVEVDMTQLTTDKVVRDRNMKSKLFHTEQYPTATFSLTQPTNLSQVPDDGTAGTVPIKGELTIKGQTQPVEADFQVIRDGKHIVISSDIAINRLDFGVETPEMIAATIAEEGQVNVRLTFAQD